MNKRSVALSMIILSLYSCGATAEQASHSSALQISDEVNRHLPAWLRFSGEYRARMEGISGAGFAPGNNDLYFLNRVRLNLAVKPSSWMKIAIQGQDAQVFGKNSNPDGPPFEDTLDLRMAYVELGDSEKGPVALLVGRQEMVFGEQRLVGHVSWLNTARTFDAARFHLRHKGARLEAFAASVVNIRDGQFNQHLAGNNFHGLYGGLERLIPKATIEPYAFWRLSPRMTTETGATGNLNSKTIGVRWVGKLPGNLDYGTELARQAGALGSDRVLAWAGHWLLGYTVSSLSVKPRLVIEYNYASGDDDPRDGIRGTFDQLYPTAHDKYGLADQVGWRNIHHVRGGLELKLGAASQITTSYHSWWLASATDALYSAT
ncbi:MAG: hypothetical protein FJW26_20550, partial [Acidimicrobiia bacterium]|nr:hypothetical protein [Acidimicrobiia bacterium]